MVTVTVMVTVTTTVMIMVMTTFDGNGNSNCKPELPAMPLQQCYSKLAPIAHQRYTYLAKLWWSNCLVEQFLGGTINGMG
jgi:hypothetical protein